MFFKEASPAHQGCIYLIKNQEKNCNIVTLLQFKIMGIYFN